MKQIFPTRYSTLSANAINEYLAEAYGFNDSFCRLVVRNVSDVYVLETPDEKYIFKIYRDAHRKLEEILGEVELLNLLAEKGCNISHPVKDSKGEEIQSFNAAEGVRYGVLFTFAHGEVIYEMNEAQLTAVGKGMAGIHNITSGLELFHKRKVYNFDSTIVQPVNLLEFAFIQYNLPEEYKWLKNTSDKILEKLNAFDFESSSYGYCHFDFFPKNFHFSASGEITFFDFDFAGPGYLTWDVASFYIHPFLQSKFNDVSKADADKMLETFVGAYRKVRPLKEKELELIPYFGFGFWVFYLGFQYESFEDWSNTFFGAKFIKDRVGLIKTWLEYTTGSEW